MKNIHKLFATILLCLFATTFATPQNMQYDTAKQAPASEGTQQSKTETVTVPSKKPPEMADRMRAEGKIYVLVAIVLVVLIGFIILLILLDRKVSRLEKILTEKRP